MTPSHSLEFTDPLSLRLTLMNAPSICVLSFPPSPCQADASFGTKTTSPDALDSAYNWMQMVLRRANDNHPERLQQRLDKLGVCVCVCVYVCVFVSTKELELIEWKIVVVINIVCRAKLKLPPSPSPGNAVNESLQTVASKAVDVASAAAGAVKGAIQSVLGGDQVRLCVFMCLCVLYGVWCLVFDV